MIIKKSNKGFKIKKASGADRSRINLFDSDTVTLEMLRNEVRKFLVPCGTILPFGGTTAPEGFLFCNGNSYNVSAYKDLHNAIGDAFGGDGGTNFNIPDFRGRFLRGLDGVAGRDLDKLTRTVMAVGGNAGNNIGSIQVNATKKPNIDFTSDTYNHSHGGVGGSGTHAHSIDQEIPGAGPGATGYFKGTTIPATLVQDPVNGNGSHSHTISSDGHSHVVTTGGDNETRPINAYVNYIIKT